MIISTERPPCADAIQKKFGVNFDTDPIAMAYGEAVHVKAGTLPDWLIDHEGTHLKQQKEIGGPEIWWERYLADDKFRFEQELEAYRAQYKWVVQNWKSQNKRFDMLRHCAETLSGPIYGNMIPFSLAMQEIRRG